MEEGQADYNFSTVYFMRMKFRFYKLLLVTLSRETIEWTTGYLITNEYNIILEKASF